MLSLGLPGRQVTPATLSDVTGFTPVTGREPSMPETRAALEAEWLHLTRAVLPGLAAARDWPVSADHCFQRILLDHAVGGRWYDHVVGRPAYRHLPDDALSRAVALGREAAAGTADLHLLDRQSLAWRGKRTVRA